MDNYEEQMQKLMISDEEFIQRTNDMLPEGEKLDWDNIDEENEYEEDDNEENENDDEDEDDVKDLIERNDEFTNKILKDLYRKNPPEMYRAPNYAHGENLLHWCGTCDNNDMAKFFVEEMGFTPDICNSRSTTALYYATLSNSENVIKTLLNNYADPRIRSGFSGMFPYQIAKNDYIKNMLLEFDKNIPIDYETGSLNVKEGYTLVQAYNYRLHRYWNTIVADSYHEMNKNYNTGQLEEKNAIRTIKEKSFEESVIEYKKIKQNWVDGINSQEIKFCLNCKAKEDLKKCSKCKQVYYCNIECQKVCHKLHKYDCK